MRKIFDDEVWHKKQRRGMAGRNLAKKRREGILAGTSIAPYAWAMSGGVCRVSFVKNFELKFKIRTLCITSESVEVIRRFGGNLGLPSA